MPAPKLPTSIRVGYRDVVIQTAGVELRIGWMYGQQISTLDAQRMRV